MEQPNYIYTNRAVAFLDVLGFQNKLKEFEDEAIQFYSDFVADNIEDDTDEDEVGGRVYYSQKATDFIETFNKAISKLDNDKFSYYLFSDNICITAKNISNDGEKSLVELLLVISELYFEFVQKGYFLRGGIDYGLFIDKASIALGVPLATAYKMESSLAVFPRIILSKDFVKQLSNHIAIDEYEIDSILNSSLVKVSCEIQYLNVFNHIFKVEDKEYFFEKYNHYISENLLSSSISESIFLKYKWLADEFNSFIETYTSTLAFYDENFDPTEEYIESIKQLKVSYGQ
ncbi:hypothetical protein BZG02_07045 [Labilibaculum filiforme]|uniref:Guanylate cyclase domain-containing protein n=1 Tax=Labilibaculum filiforme TaxID=1940526 RepID=A0A2N3I0C8_9BACT|nr:hypothetical protein [Labilibaculum filiforme]PKQ63778.1 hypothetical protein BZG02_07045 [Labilibaculum filiforme]